MATIYDVARISGVSPKTVSRVINGDAAVRDSTKMKVQVAISELGYVPSTAARTMRSNKSGLVGLITGAISLSSERTETSGLPEILIVQGIQKAIEASGKTLLIADTGGQTDRVPQLIRTFEEHRVEGIIYAADYHRKIELPPISDSTKITLANCYDDAGTPCVLPNDYQGQKSLVLSLIASGHRRIAYLTLSPKLDATVQRTAGYKQALEAKGIAFDTNLLLTAGTDMPDSTAEEQLLWDAIDRVLNLPEPPTAICFGNDRMAMRAYGILRSRGLSLPGDVSIAGYDNHKMITQTLYPTLTSAELPYAAIGLRATELLLDMIRDDRPRTQDPILVSGPVVNGKSVKELPPKITKLSTIRRTTNDI